MLPELRSSRDSLSWYKTKGFIVIRASHKIIADNACRNRKLLVIKQVGSLPNSIKSDLPCRNLLIFFVEIHIQFLKCCFGGSRCQPKTISEVFFQTFSNIISLLTWSDKNLANYLIELSSFVPLNALVN